MHIKVPVYSRFGPNVVYKDGEACCKDKDGEVTWAYSGKDVTGKGIFVCASPRSATSYMTLILRELGYDIGHEKADKDGSVGYHLAVIQPENCFHQVRHPLNQISSMQSLHSWGFMDTVVNVANHKLLGMMQCWLQWNEICESFCVWRYRIEDLPDAWPELLWRIGHYNRLALIPPVPTNTNSWKHTMLNWDDLYECNSELSQEIYDKHLEYGYSPARDREESLQISG
jgi:hypothetical protein